MWKNSTHTLTRDPTVKISKFWTPNPKNQSFRRYPLISPFSGPLSTFFALFSNLGPLSHPPNQAMIAPLYKELQ